MFQNIKSLAKANLLFALLTIISYAQAQQGDPKMTEIWEPQPKIVTPGIATGAPSDAIILFDGSDLSKWQHSDGKPAQWEVKDGIMTVKPGTGVITTKQAFGDMQLHVEFRTPEKVEGESQGRGNSGIIIQGRYEVQVLDCYNNKTYSNGMIGSIYKQYIPLANACRKPGEWQTYDIIFTAPRFNDEGRAIVPANVTVLLNNILVQNHVDILGTIQFIGLPKYEKHNLKEPLTLQDHGNLVSYRNIWVREL